MHTFLREAPRDRAARRLDAWLRIAIVQTLRHELLRGHRGRRGVPPTLLTAAQLSLAPNCDLSCEGCFTAGDRGGTAPTKDRIAFMVDQVIACGAFAVHVIGKGEPFLSRAWADELLDVIAEWPHAFFTIATHGMHFDSPLARR
ncbi:MAG: hypothetical protein HYV63_04920 [Candidatus Schekmanbacteria bacterium]|nr:hypothetical protein [Candidatus Schekmanbacteria bacterium]